MREVLLLRHGQAEGIHPAAALLAEGEAQAQQVAEHLNPWVQKGLEVVSSPYPRAKETARLIAVRWGLTPLSPLPELIPEGDERVAEADACILCRYEQGWVDEIIDDINLLCERVKKAKANEEVRETIRLGFFEPSYSPWACAIVLAKTKGNQLRVVVICGTQRSDCQRLSRVNESFARLGNTRFVTALVIAFPFWQNPFRPGDEHKTTFAYELGWI